ncbi:MAG TPA: tRNA (adenosine(37)-N6)-threonylcarbamoyltransferase complex ATPase subunit type 1 TsaE [Anaerolinea sp.]|nr:tRNA (adenosine(37)-N6)-threonylcarbamoyltransferase complex ATPase subunit type 1 TsaE [Anaerolinea sp.]
MPILDSRTFEFISRSPEQTRRLGARLGTLLLPGDLVCLSGDLGSGKTTMVQGLAQGWGTLDQVSSPTFVLVNEYRRPDQQSLFHLDAYRLKNALEAEDLDLDRMLESGALVLEWAERIAQILPPERIWGDLRWLADEQRGMVISVRGARYEALLADFRQKVFGG